MLKKLLVILLLLSISIFSCSACFADDMVKIGGGGTGLLIYVNYQDTRMEPYPGSMWIRTKKSFIMWLSWKMEILPSV